MYLNTTTTAMFDEGNSPKCPQQVITRAHNTAQTSRAVLDSNENESWCFSPPVAN